MIFLSHASVDGALAESLARHIEECGPGVKTFCASRAGDIPADAEWLPSVQKALRDADAYVILLTVNSVDRPWVSFETGAAWFSGKKYILVKVGGLTRAEIPLPLSAKQVYALDAVDDARAVFRDLGLKSQAIEELVAEVVSLLPQMQLAGEGEPAWEGLEFQGTFYAWAGRLLVSRLSWKWRTAFRR